MINCLRISYAPDDQWHGERMCSIESEGFSGHGSAWFNRSDIEDFVARLEPCPIPDGRLPTLAGDIFDSESLLIDEHLGLRIAHHDIAGTLQVDAHVVTFVRERSGKELRLELTASFITTYAQVARFKTSLAALLCGAATEAVLFGQVYQNC